MTAAAKSNGDVTPAHARLVLIGAIVAVSTAIAVLTAVGRYAFIWKTAIIPVLLIAAFASRRFARFVDDWGIFLALVIIFDFLRGLVFASITHWQLPVYMQYAIAAERWLCGGDVMPIVLQRWRAHLPWAGAADRFLTVVHGSHFAFFLLFGLAVWMLRPEQFRRYAVAVIALIYLGALLYLLVPTVPPWMAAADFGVLPHVEHITAHLYNTNLPVLQDAFDVNPIAAMPSLHAALPTLCVLIGAEIFGGAALVLLVGYLGLVYLAIIYLGEHYLVDVLAGALLASLVFAFTRRYPLSSWLRRPVSVRPALLTALLIVLAEGIGQLTITWLRPFEVTPEFAARELVGRTPLAHLFLGRFAFERGDLSNARGEFEQAVAQIDNPSQQRLATCWLARTAYRLGDYDAVIAAVAPMHDDGGVDTQVLLARAYLAAAQRDAGETLLRHLVLRYPHEPEPLYWLTLYDYEERRLSADQVRQIASRLEGLEIEDGVDGYSGSLMALVQR